MPRPHGGKCKDIDSIHIHVLLHVVDGFMNELEIYKDDSSRVQKVPPAEDLTVFSQCDKPVIDWPARHS
jgi:hypothetical protein